MDPRCKECGGMCCEAMLLPIPEITLGIVDERWLVLRDVSIVRIQGEPYWHFHRTCVALSPDHTCSIYDYRPGSCRTFEIDGPLCKFVRGGGR